MASSRRILLAAVCGLAAGCASESAPEIVISWEESAGHRSRSLQFTGTEGGGFTVMEPGTTGIAGRTDLGLEPLLENRTLSLGTGVALGDVDGDGRVDVYVCLLDGSNALYRNLGGWRFEDVTAASGAALPDRVARSAAFADADGDGDLDLFVGVHAGRNVLLRNDGSGVFEEADAGFEGEWGTTTLTLADIDSDGDLDPYFANYKTIQVQDLFPPEQRTSRAMVIEEDGELRIRPEFADHFMVERLDEERIRRRELADPDELYLNDGSGRFAPVPFTGAGFADASGARLAETPRDWGLVARFYDFDDDHDPDLYVSNDFGSPDGIWLNDGGVLRAASGLQVRTTSGSSMGVDFADVDRDGDTDFVTTEMPAFDRTRRRTEMGFVAVRPTPPGASAERAIALRNVLQLNRGDATFAEVGRAAGIEASDWTWGALFLDADLDGYEDLFVTNGNVWNALDGDTHDGLRTGRINVDWRQEVRVFPPMPQRNLAFRNRGDGTFTESSVAWGFGDDPDVSHGIATADLDRDGDLDIVITRFDQPPLVLRNDSGGARVAVRLVGAAPNTQAIGARVTLEGGAIPEQSRQVTAGGMYLSGSDPQLAFAMGEETAARLHVVWPSGATTSLDVAPDRLYEIREPEASPAGGAPTDATPAETPSADAARFERLAVAPRHEETAFDERVRQPLLPIELSRLGPGVSWEDVDRDGDPDLLTPAAAGGRTLVARVEDGSLMAPEPLGPPVPGDLTTVLGMIGPEGYVLVSGVSNWEGMTPEALQATPSLIDVEAGTPLLPGEFNTVGPLAVADVDGDGDLDLFMGGRAVPGAYPLPATSRLFRNEGGRWAEDPGEAAAFRSIGLVSAAAFSDVDVDGDPDLLLALEWGPLRLFRNDGGRFTEATDDWGLAGLTGRWNGIATGDLDADGRPDLVATSWGLNTGTTVTPDRPAQVFAADFDGNGQVDVLEAWTDASGAAIPVRDFMTLSRALPFIRREISSFEAFSRAGVDELIGERPGPVFRAEAATLAHTVFLNRGDRFEPSALPRAAQLAPGFGVVVADFDRDGSEDVFIAQNFFATPEGVDRSDAGRGALLLGDGSGGFEVADEGALGLAVYGDARGAAVADFDADGRWDLAVGQNGEETAVFRGAGGAPGLRVRLVGPATNPDAIGASVRVVFDGGAGPAREIQAGAGYWSRNGATQVFGIPSTPRAVRVRWPGGAETEHPVEPGVRDLTIPIGG